ncbi:class I SAM-dependent methyltransferase [Candidatus Woesearchaeota archaeon]|nr:class I SAM-dependent methyltransferase [Candidatus Woesearchaeota archaeon]
MHERVDPYYDKHIMALSRYAHLRRYRHVLSYTKSDSVVLDAGCGSGYGSSMLAERALEVTGIDSSAEAITHAQERYAHPKVTYVHGDIEDPSVYPDQVFTIISLFEVLEHVAHPDKVLRLFREHIHEQGMLFLSVPNGKNLVDHNESHEHTYTKEDLEALIDDSGFQVEQILGQYPLIGFMTGMLEKVRHAQCSTDMRWGLLSRGINHVPFSVRLFSGIYNGDFALATSRTLYVVATPKYINRATV